ncbi:MAG: sigma-70 family RNA polymerase sigma factor [Isosphaeraceae bacterium]
MATNSCPDTPRDALDLYRRLGDPRAFRKLWESYQGPAARFAMYCGADGASADDVVQRTFLKLMKRLRTFDYDPNRSFRAYLRRVIRSQVSKQLGEFPPFAELDSNMAAADTPPTFDTSSLGDGKVSPEDALAKLEERVRSRVQPDTWRAYRLVQHEKITRLEVARLMGWDYARVFQAHARVLAMLMREAERERGAGR